MILNVEEKGSGPSLVLVHGFGASAYAWRKLVGGLEQHFHLHLVDLKGHGRAKKPRDKKYTVIDQAALLTDYVRGIGEKQVILIGHSFGGGVCLTTTLNLMDSGGVEVSHLVLMDSMAYPQPLPSFINLLTVPVVGRAAMSLLPATWQARLVLGLAYHDRSRIEEEAVAAYAEPLRESGMKHALIQTARGMRFGDYGEIYRRYPEIACRTLVLWGEHDSIVRREVGERLRDAIPGCEWKVIEDCGHNPMEEQAGETLARVESFLGVRSMQGGRT